MQRQRVAGLARLTCSVTVIPHANNTGNSITPRPGPPSSPLSRPGTRGSSSSRGGRRKLHMQLAEKLRPVRRSKNLAREYAPELSVIRESPHPLPPLRRSPSHLAPERASAGSVDDLNIDYSQALSIKRGDLSIIQGEARDPPLSALSPLQPCGPPSPRCCTLPHPMCTHSSPSA